MSRIIIHPHKFGSAGAKALSRGLPAVRVRDTGRYRKRVNDFIINWGNTLTPSWGKPSLNQPEAVSLAVNKVTALNTMKEAGVRTVEHTSDSDIVQQWLDEGHSVYARTLTRASEGRGIHVLTGGMQIPDARLYTKGIKDGTEYRLHVFDGVVIDYTKKVPIDPLSTPNSDVKSHGNGWTFARNVERRPSLETEAVKAVRALGLDFGAVDIITFGKTGVRVLEVNSACGLVDGGRTYQNYVNAIRNYVRTKVS